jgi:P2 family phage contractile tail tube protein
VLKLFGLAPGQLTPLTIRGAVISDDGTQTTVVVNLQGIVREMDPGNWKPGEKATLKIMMALRYYKFHVSCEASSIDEQGHIFQNIIQHVRLL